MRNHDEVIVLIPAHNEQDQLGAALTSVLRQSRPPDGVVVAADNCSDATVAVASSFDGVEVFETADNRARKAGALNQAWRRAAQEADFVVTLDADTVLHDDFIRTALKQFRADVALGGLCGRFMVKPGKGLVWRLQKLEYARADDNKLSRGMRISVLAGAGCVYRQQALLAVRQHRSRKGRDGAWDGTTLVEDYALTLDLQECRWLVRSGTASFAFTDTPETLLGLWRQRTRWERGTVDELRRRGWTRATRRDILVHVALCWLVLVRLAWVGLIAAALAFGLGIGWHWIWLLPLVLALAERLTSLHTLRDPSWRDLALSGSLVVEELYSTFQHAYFTGSVLASYRRSTPSW